MSAPMIDGGNDGATIGSGVTRSAVGATAALALAAALAVLPPVSQPACAQDGWNPFAESNAIRPTPRREARPAEPAAPQIDEAPAPVAGRERVERADLAPLADAPGPPPAAGSPPSPAIGTRSSPSSAPAASAGPGFDPKMIEPLLASLDVPSRSPALTSLLRRLLAGPDAVLAGGGPEQIAIRIEALYRAGLIADAVALAPGSLDSGTHPILTTLVSRAALAVGRTESACEAARLAVPARAALPPALKGEVIATQGWCAAAEGNAGAAGLAAALAREEQAGAADTLAALDAVSAGDAPRFATFKRISVLDFKIAQVVKESNPEGYKAELDALPVERAEPALLAVIAADKGIGLRLRLAGAEAAARLNVIGATELAAAYRTPPFTADQLAQPQSSTLDGALRRALLLAASEAERTPARKTRLVRMLLDDARRAGLYLPIAAALARTVDEVAPAVEIGWFAETAVETMLIAGRFDKARAWTTAAPQTGSVQDRAGSLAHWLALIDIADPAQSTQRGESLASVEELALRGRFTSDALHRLATVLDALDYDVPHRLWEAASRAPQPNAGYLPPTGLLSDLQDAAKRRDQARTILLVIRALGPNAGESAHIIALGDSIRALKRAGLEREARQLGLEALFAAWPRTSHS